MISKEYMTALFKVNSKDYYIRDYLGSVRGVVDGNGTLEQATDYHSGGIPSSDYGNFTADDRLHTGKEFNNFAGLAWYDNSARMYDPITTRFTTPDPLAEKYPDQSPYAHCANNPLKYIDPNAMEWEYIVDGCGWISRKWVNNEGTDLAGYDVMISKLNNGDVNPQIQFPTESIMIFERGVNLLTEYIGPESSQYSLLDLPNNGIAKYVFEFLSKNTNVEFSLASYGDADGDGKNMNFILTSHEEGDEAGFISYLSSGGGLRMDLKEYSHNHPAGTEKPSGTDGRYGDVQIAQQLSERFGFQLKFNIYVLDKKSREYKYIPFSGRSVADDFKTKSQ